MVCFHTKKIIHRKFKVKHASFKGLSLLPPLLIARQDVEKAPDCQGQYWQLERRHKLQLLSFRFVKLMELKGSELKRSKLSAVAVLNIGSIKVHTAGFKSWCQIPKRRKKNKLRINWGQILQLLFFFLKKHQLSDFHVASKDQSWQPFSLKLNCSFRLFFGVWRLLIENQQCTYLVPAPC